MKVDVNNRETQINVTEASFIDTDIQVIVDDHNPDCFVVVYAIDDQESFGELHFNEHAIKKPSEIVFRLC